MEKRKNLYKMDDFCLFLSVILFLVFIFQFRFLLPYFAGSDFKLIIDAAKEFVLIYPIRIGLLLFSAIFFQIIGRVVRKKEKISLEVIEAISYRSRASIGNLASELGRDQESLNKICRQLAAIPGAGVSFDGNYVKIDRKKPEDLDDEYSMNKDRIMNGEIPMADNPAEKDTDNEFPEDFPDILKKVGVNPEDLKDKFERMKSEQGTSGNSSIPTFTPPTGPDGQKLKPNPVIVIILFIVFWPLAIVYILSFYMKNMQKKAIQDGINKNS